MTAARILAVAALLALAAYAWRGWYSRYVRDDYCTAVTLREHGFAGAGRQHRQEWSGRFSYFVFKGILESAGPWTPRVVPGLLLAAFTGIATWGIRRTVDGTGLAFTTAAVLVFAAFDASPKVLDWGGPLVWETGAVTYTLPLLLITAWLGLFSLRGSATAVSIAGAALLFVAGGLSETSLAAQAALSGGLGIAALLFRNRRFATIAACGFVGTMAALAVVVPAPGNRVREAELPEHQPLAMIAIQMMEEVLLFFRDHVLRHGAALLLVVAVGLLLGASTRLRPRVAMAIGLVAFAALVASVAPSAWILSGRAPLRALHVTTHFLVLAVAAFSVAVGAARAIAPRVALAALLSVIPLWSAVQTVRTIPDARRTIAEIDRITGALQKGGDVVLRSPWALQSEFADRRPEYWTNRCMCRYYGARSLHVTP